MENFLLLESDTEFWEELDKDITLDQCSKASKALKPVGLDEQITEFTSTVPSTYYRDRLQYLITQVRMASKVKFKEKYQSYKRKVSKDHQSQINELKVLHKGQVEDLIQDYRRLEHKLIEKDLEINRLNRLLIDQERSLTVLRVDKGNKYDEENRVKEIRTIMETNKMTFDILMAHMKEVVEEYKKDTDVATENLQNLQSLYQEQLNQLDQQKIAFSEEINKCKEECDSKVEAINEKYEKFKNDTIKELNIRYLINKRQTDFIEMLKKELKTAKLVIETPRIRSKYLEKLKHRNFSISSTLEDSLINPVSKKVPGLLYKNPGINSSISTMASPVYTNSSELDLNRSMKYAGLIPEIKHN
jgi:hypothetical protein